MNFLNNKKNRFEFTNPFLILLFRSHYKSWRLRKRGREMRDLHRLEAHYRPHGEVKLYPTHGGKTGVFRLITWLPYIELDENYGPQGEESDWEFLGFHGEKPIMKMTFKEYLKTFEVTGENVS